MQYTVAETATLNVIASVNCKLKYDKGDGTYSTVSDELAGTDLGTSDGVTREIVSEVSGKITALSIYNLYVGNVWVDLAKVYFTHDFGDGYKYSVKGSANYDATEDDKPKTVAKPDPKKPVTLDQPTDPTEIDALQKAKDLYKVVTGKEFPADGSSSETLQTAIDLYEKLTGQTFPLKTKITAKKKPVIDDPTIPKGIDWAKYLKWGGIGLAVIGAFALGYYLFSLTNKQEKELTSVASPQQDVPTLSGSIPKPIGWA